MRRSLLADWTADDFGTLERGVLLAPHRLVETGLFDDDRLIEIIDNHPDADLTISTMGHDSNTFEWREGDRNGVSGVDLLDLVRKGRLWISCRRMMRNHPEYRRLVDQLFDELKTHAPGFRPDDRSANLLISSPKALVHYHIDTPVNMLWHLRGRKRVWVYPHFDHRFVSQQVVELVCAGDLAEDVPYDPEFDRYALVFDVEPGQMLTWPQVAPHRVTNIEGLNVSLSTEHRNRRSVRRVNVHVANRWLRTHVGRCHHSTDVDGPTAHAKQALARCTRIAARLFGRRKEEFIYPATFKVDLDSPTGYTLVDVPPDQVIAPHTKLELSGGTDRR